MDVRRILRVRRVVAVGRLKLAVVARTAFESVAPGLQHEVDDAALEAGLFGRRADRLHLQFGHHVVVGPVVRTAERRRRDVEAVVLKRVLARLRSEDDELARGADALACGLHSRSVGERVEELVARGRRILEQFLVEIRARPGVNRIDDR